MKAAKTWCVASVLVLAAFASASCGKDEASGDDDDDGMIVGGSGGTGGTQGRGGTTSAGTSGSMNSANKLGRGCIDDADCADANAPGLRCVTATDTVLGEGAPPKGLCTAECTSDDECGELGAGSLCFPFTDGAASGYCVEGCAFGAPELGEIKCHNRPEFACTFAGAIDTGEPCTDSETDCQPGEFCSDGTCLLVVPACLPSCRGDIDCEDGMYCDQSFLSGVCVDKKPVGKGLGEPCTVLAGDESEPDECLGFCQPDSADGQTGHCAATCALGRECGWNSDTEKFDGACLYASVITREIGSLGDFGFCTPTCNCSEECNDPALGCFLLDGDPLQSSFRGPGLCFSPDPTNPNEEQYNQCTGSGGVGGMGGVGTGGAGGGAGGGPSGEGGTPVADGGGAGGVGGGG